MPVTNHCRDALIQHCIEVVDGDAEAAVRILDRVVKTNADFLVVPACVPPGSETRSLSWKSYLKRFDAGRWVRTHTSRTRASYRRLLSRAYLLTPNLEVPPVMWEDDMFLVEFRSEAESLLRVRTPPRRHNFACARQHPVGGLVVADIEQGVPTVVQRYERLYWSLVQTLQTGLPPPEIIERFGFTYCDLLDRVGNLAGSDLDVDAALLAGARRQTRSHGTWSVSDTRRVVELLGLYVGEMEGGHLKTEIGERYEQLAGQNTARSNSTNRVAIETGTELGVWRIRKSDSERWRNSLTQQEWSEYLGCEMLMRQTLPSGVVSRVPRRHYNRASVRNMKEHNLTNLKARFASGLCDNRKTPPLVGDDGGVASGD